MTPSPTANPKSADALMMKEPSDYLKVDAAFGDLVWQPKACKR